MRRHILLLCAIVQMLMACAPPWQLIPESVTATGATYRVELPAGWMRYIASHGNLFISHDGPALQGIEVRTATPQLAFKTINETLSPNALPSELAELALALAKNEYTNSRVVLLENTPALIAGRQGFRLHFRLDTSRGLEYDAIIYGVATSKQVYMIKYYATHLHYFSRGNPAYEKLIQSFQITEG